MIKIRLFTLLLFILSPLSVQAQDYYFKNYSVDDGLPQSQVSSIIQDNKGFIWVGTYNGGIAKFDGKSFSCFNTKTGLNSNNVNFLFQDSKGILWICTDNGICQYDGKYFSAFGRNIGLHNAAKVRELDKGVYWVPDLYNGLFKFSGSKFVKFTIKDGLADNRVRDILKDKAGKYWIATENGLNIYDGNKFVTIKKGNGIAEDFVRSIFQDSKGNIWLGHNKTVTKYDGKSFLVMNDKNGMLNSSVLSIYEDKSGNVWFCTFNGLFKYNGSEFIYVNPFGNFRSKTIYTILEDREHNLWVGTDARGIFKLTVSNFTHFDDKDGLPGDYVWCIMEDSKHNTWFGTNNGLAKYDGRHFTTYYKNDGLLSNVIYSLYEDKQGVVWVGTTEGLSSVNGSKIKSYPVNDKRNRSVLAISEDKDVLWIGTFDGAYRFDRKKFIFYSLNDTIPTDAMGIYKDKDGKLWFSSEQNGLYFFDGKKFIKSDQQFGISTDKIWNVVQDYKGNFWFGHSENGLMFYNSSKRNIERLTTNDGLIDDAIYTMAIDKSGYLWIGTNSGISCFDIKSYYESGSKYFLNYGKHDGFIGIECNQNAICADSKGNIWFGTIKGATRYNMSKGFERFSVYEPLTYITGIKLFLESEDLARWSDNTDSTTRLPINLKLPYNKNHITFDFIGLSYMNPDRIYYSYKLYGADKTWTIPSKATHATYTNLSPGEYKFEVRACNKDGVWSTRPAAFHFIIKPPYYSTWWFIVMVIAGVICVILIFSNYRTLNLERQKRELEEIVALRTRELQEEKEKEELANQELEYMNENLAEANRNLGITNMELEKLSIVTRETDNSIYVTDKNGNLEWINASVFKNMGYTLEELIVLKGKNLKDIISHPNIEILVAHSINEKKPVSFETVNTTKTGSKYWAACTLTPILDDHDEIKNLVIVETNITDRKIIEKQLQDAYEELENRVEERTKALQESNLLLKTEIHQREQVEKELIIAKEHAEQADRLKSVFLAQISHEIRTPLNVILSYTTLLRDSISDKLTEEMKSVFFGIGNAGKRLIRTIDLILNMSAIQTGTHDLSIREFSLDQTLSKLVMEFNSLLKDKNIKLKFENRLDEALVIADEYTVDQIFQNLIDNAIKYTLKGNVEIIIYRDELEKVCVDVKDDGIGISEEFLSNLFQPFTQEEMGYTRKYEGNGLGLALVKNYIDMNNAEISVKSTKGKGSIFTVKFRGD